MVRALIIIAAIALTGCETVKLRTETVEVVRPVLYCPAPDYEALDRPASLAIDDITPTMPAGEIAIRYKATVLQLQGYVQRLERTLDQYEDTSGALDELRQELEKQQTNR